MYAHAAEEAQRRLCIWIKLCVVGLFERELLEQYNRLFLPEKLAPALFPLGKVRPDDAAGKHAVLWPANRKSSPVNMSAPAIPALQRPKIGPMRPADGSCGLEIPSDDLPGCPHAIEDEPAHHPTKYLPSGNIGMQHDEAVADIEKGLAGIALGQGATPYVIYF